MGKPIQCQIAVNHVVELTAEEKAEEMCIRDRFQAYTSTLSAEEYNKLMENLNDDDYMEEFIGKDVYKRQVP